MPVDSIIEFSHAIVLGRLTIVDLDSTDALEKGTGYITVEEVVAGPVAVGESIPFEWHVPFDTGVVCPLPFRYQPLNGVLGVWFLQRGIDGVLHPIHEFWNLESLQSLDFHAKVLASLKPRTKRTSLLLSIVEHRLKDS
ncbi:MAG TPA: hypothetical protein VF179_02865 [Thermoanaerobaculia bacterium]|nr:hypothetical protein [Thermoanaerobaculia bacterium]